MTKPIVPALVPTASEAFTGPPDKPMVCLGCSGYHGSVGKHRLCLESNLRAAREANRWAYGTLMGIG